MEAKYKFAQANGFRGSFDEYVKLNYDIYCSLCIRCHIVPMGFAEWKASNA